MNVIKVKQSAIFLYQQDGYDTKNYIAIQGTNIMGSTNKEPKKQTESLLRTGIYGTTLLSPGDCFVVIVPTLRCIMCISKLHSILSIYAILSQANVIGFCDLVIILDVVGIILCTHIVMPKANVIVSCALFIILDVVGIILCTHIVMPKANVIVSCALIIIFAAGVLYYYVHISLCHRRTSFYHVL